MRDLGSMDYNRVMRVIELVLVTALALGGCSESHEPSMDPSGGSSGMSGGSSGMSGGSSGMSGGSMGSGSTGGAMSGSGMGGTGSSGGMGTAVDAATPPVDVLSGCMRACDRIAECIPGYDSLDCLSQCLSARENIESPACEGLLVGIFSCLENLDCDEVSVSDDGEPELEHTSCAGLLNLFEDECADD